MGPGILPTGVLVVHEVHEDRESAVTSLFSMFQEGGNCLAFFAGGGSEGDDRLFTTCKDEVAGMCSPNTGRPAIASWMSFSRRSRALRTFGGVGAHSITSTSGSDQSLLTVLSPDIDDLEDLNMVVKGVDATRLVLFNEWITCCIFFYFYFYFYFYFLEPPCCREKKTQRRKSM